MKPVGNTLRITSDLPFRENESEVPGGWTHTHPTLLTPRGVGTPHPYITHTPGVSGNF